MATSSTSASDPTNGGPTLVSDENDNRNDRSHPFPFGHLSTDARCPRRYRERRSVRSQPDARERVLREYRKITHPCADIADLLSREDVPIVPIAMPTIIVPGTVRAAARSSKHIYSRLI